jgi:hypothetical protein
VTIIGIGVGFINHNVALVAYSHTLPCMGILTRDATPAQVL